MFLIGFGVSFIGALFIIGNTEDIKSNLLGVIGYIMVCIGAAIMSSAIS